MPKHMSEEISQKIFLLNDFYKISNMKINIIIAILISLNYFIFLRILIIKVD